MIYIQVDDTIMKRKAVLQESLENLWNTVHGKFTLGVKD